MSEERTVLLYVSGERFRWEAEDRATGTVYREGEAGLGSFRQLNAKNLKLIRLCQPVEGGELQVDVAIPDGAEAVFWRRRKIDIGGTFPRDMTTRLGWTIVGYKWQDGTGLYNFFDDLNDTYFTSTDFNAV